MFKSIYKKLAEDFNFVKEYHGYCFKYDMKHYERPSIVFGNEAAELRIGFNYDNNRFYTYIYDLKIKDGYYKGIDILEDVSFSGKSYKEQVEQVKTILLKHLQKL